ncbi:unnamed protein product [Toxocara canis]|uniref:Saposin B-type domain-containing protein n=1 Tax=Toxocara canis TaxID=6265 RepID=A0A183UUS2_TOXCA|nr:unnamed protein product [Toxocara canis]
MMAFRLSKTLPILLMLIMLLNAEEIATDLSCRICMYMVPVLHTSKSLITSCRDRLPADLCNAIEKTADTKMPIRYNEAACTPGFCARYTAESTCAISIMLMKVAETNKQQPEEEFEGRLRLSCTQLDFLDPPCNMIVDEYWKQMHELALRDVPFDEACKQIGLCP